VLSTAICVISEVPAFEIGAAVGSEVGSAGPIVVTTGEEVAVGATVSEARASSVLAVGVGESIGNGDSEGIGVLDEIEIVCRDSP